MASLHNAANKTTVPAPNVGSVQYVISFLLASLCYFLITQLIFFLYSLYVCFVYSVFSYHFCIVLCIVFPFIAVSFLFMYKSTDHCHWVETQL